MESTGRELRDRVRQAYSDAAARPREKHGFPVGRAFAESLGYPPDVLASAPPACVEAFTGVSNVSLFAEIAPGSEVLDLGCGAGLDTLVAARRTGPHGGVVSVDFSMTMLERARCAAAASPGARVALCQASAEELPLAGGSIDVALVNGIFNLNPVRAAIFRELARVLRPAGAVYAAELILTQPLPPEQQNRANWFA